MENSTEEQDYKQRDMNVQLSQKGLVDFPDHAIFATFFLNNCKSHAIWMEAVKVSEEACQAAGEGTVCVRGVDCNLWNQWCEQMGKPVPKGETNYERMSTKPFTYTAGDFWFHIKGNSLKACTEVLRKIEISLESCTEKLLCTEASKEVDGKIFGGRFRDAMINPVDPVNLSERIIVGHEDEYYRGSAYVLQQRFKHNWEMLDQMSQVEKENMIGRNENNAIIPMQGDNSHIRCVRKLDGERVTLRILRQAMPYGQTATGRGKEAGVYFAAYAKDGEVFNDLMGGIIGDKEGFIKDRMLNTSHSEEGNFWFIPSAKEAGLSGPKKVDVPMNEYFNIRSENGLMYYNNRDFLHELQKKASQMEISDRIALLIADTFSKWNDTWEKKITMPALGHLSDYLESSRWQEYKWVADSSAALRKGLATKISLEDVLQQDKYRECANLNTVTAREIIVGNMPPITLGSGSRVMEYLKEDEKIEFFFGSLNEYSATGHNVPNYRKVLRLGMKGLLAEANQKLSEANDETRHFYQSVVWSLEGLKEFILHYSRLADELLRKTPKSCKEDYANLEGIRARMEKLADGRPEGVLESLQMIFIVNCALHQSGENMSIGRLDQYLIDAYEKELAAGTITESRMQELLDAFWLKMDETVLYNRQHMQDYLTYGSGAVFYSAGNFPQGSALNQWVQQVTIGGYLPTDDVEGTDGCNAISLMCLKSARRLPLNAPCLSFRLHKNMDSPLHREMFDEAAKAVLSGGAHPVLMNDDKLTAALMKSGPMKLADAREYTSDGCYEPIIEGKTEWAFSYVPILPVVGMAMNQGATIQGAGWVNLRGLKSSWNSPPPEEIKSWKEFEDIFYTHYKWQISKFYDTLMSSYGALWNVCPSPLFSSMTDGCMESGRDMTNGGAEYRIVAPMMCGITNTINAMYAIKKMVFDKETAVTTLPELLSALWNDWGQNMQEPFHNVMAGPARAEATAERYGFLREHALSLPKFGLGECEEVKKLGEDLVGRCVDIIRGGIDNPLPGIKKGYDSIKEKYALEGRPFAFTVTPGVGTFEDNLGLGLGMGASADGRLAGETIAADFSAAPSPADKAPETKPVDIFKALKDWNVSSIGEGLSNAAPTDLNIREDFPVNQLAVVIKKFADSELGSNLMTITTGNPETYEGAVVYPEKYDLVRVRQGGWSEFYMAMFPQHQNYIARRVYYGPESTAE